MARDFDERQGEAGQLEAFLEETCLVNDTDAWETETDRVTPARNRWHPPRRQTGWT